MSEESDLQTILNKLKYLSNLATEIDNLSTSLHAKLYDTKACTDYCIEDVIVHENNFQPLAKELEKIDKCLILTKGYLENVSSNTSLTEVVMENTRT